MSDGLDKQLSTLALEAGERKAVATQQTLRRLRRLPIMPSDNRPIMPRAKVEGSGTAAVASEIEYATSSTTY